MSSIQRIIKYVAIAFAIFLIFNILSVVVFGIGIISNIFSDKDIISDNLQELTISSIPNSIDIETSSVNIIIKEGSSFKVETNNKNITIKERYNKLSIEEKNYNWFNNSETSQLILYVPSELTFDNVAIESGAGKVTIGVLSTKKFDLDLGAGKVDIHNLKVSSQAEIDGGAGEIIIDNSIIHNLDLDQGLGKVSLTAKLSGKNEINSGVGGIELYLLGSEEDYRVNIEKGIGTAKIEGNEIKNNTAYGMGSNFIDIDGGVGSIAIEYR